MNRTVSISQIDQLNELIDKSGSIVCCLGGNDHFTDMSKNVIAGNLSAVSGFIEQMASTMREIGRKPHQNTPKAIEAKVSANDEATQGAHAALAEAAELVEQARALSVEAAKLFKESGGDDRELELVFKEFAADAKNCAWLPRSYLSGEWKEDAA